MHVKRSVTARTLEYAARFSVAAEAKELGGD
jgi:hypothetical protein